MAEEKEKTEENVQERTERHIYELGYHIVPTIGEDQLPKAVGEIKGVIEKFGGTLVSEEAPTHITLAYAIVRSRGGKYEQFASAYFGWMKFEMDAENATALREELGVRTDVLRFLLFKTVREDTRASRRVLAPQKPAEPIRPKLTEVSKKATPEQKMSDEELDKTIDELVVE